MIFDGIIKKNKTMKLLYQIAQQNDYDVIYQTLRNHV